MRPQVRILYVPPKPPHGGFFFALLSRKRRFSPNFDGAPASQPAMHLHACCNSHLLKNSITLKVHTLLFVQKNSLKNMQVWDEFDTFVMLKEA
jgi:hypothetical protein